MSVVLGKIYEYLYLILLVCALNMGKIICKYTGLIHKAQHVALDLIWLPEYSNTQDLETQAKFVKPSTCCMWSHLFASVYLNYKFNIFSWSDWKNLVWWFASVWFLKLFTLELWPGLSIIDGLVGSPGLISVFSLSLMLVLLHNPWNKPGSPGKGQRSQAL